MVNHFSKFLSEYVMQAQVNKQPSISAGVKINTRISATALQDSAIPIRNNNIEMSDQNKVGVGCSY